MIFNKIQKRSKQQIESYMIFLLNTKLSTANYLKVLDEIARLKNVINRVENSTYEQCRKMYFYEIRKDSLIN